jgi:tetratricopeptide (TPR) repeat protein
MRFEIGTARRAVMPMLAFGLSLMAFMAPALADGGGSAGPPPNIHQCGKGEYWSDQTGRCEKLRADVMPDKKLAAYAYALAKAERYDEAVAVLDLMKNPYTAEALNYRGYATRHLGKLDEGIGYYLRSVRLDPRYAKVREYLGEAYVIKGDLPSARYQLHKIKTICGNTHCEEYADLAMAIAGEGNERSRYQQLREPAQRF